MEVERNARFARIVPPVDADVRWRVLMVVGTLVCDDCGYCSEEYCESYHATRGLFIIYQNTVDLSFRQFQLAEPQRISKDWDFSADARANARENEIFSNFTEEEQNGKKRLIP